MTGPSDSTRARILRALRYMGERPETDMSVDALSRVAGLSKFHFHRQFRAVLGTMVGRVVSLLRLKQASMALAFESDQKIIETDGDRRALHRLAVATHRGSTDALGETVDALYRDWLPSSGESPRAFPVFFRYVAMMPEVSEHEQVTEVHLPLVDRHLL